ncbi:hypothetical protein [Actinoplanes nipponensis]|nr:hypothetical protein [Actinoplanes nipponensis]
MRRSDQLLHYAAAAQLEHVRSETGYTHEKVGKNLGIDKTNFARLLQNPTDDFLHDLDEAVMTLVPALDRTGGLSALAVRLRRLGTRNALTARLPPRWRRRVLRRQASDELDWLSKASGLLAKLLAVPDHAKQVCERNSAELSDIVQRLILIGAAPPTPDNIDALIMLGSIAGTPAAFDVVGPTLEQALSTHPLGFRMWRSVTSIVRLNETEADAAPIIRPWVQAQVEAAEEWRARSLFPARSLDLELAIVVPAAWSPAGEDDWVSQALRERSKNTEATVRERGTAAFGLWQRALRGDDAGHQAETARFLRGLIDDFKAEAEAGDVLLGLNWVATTLAQSIEGKNAVPPGWPPTEDPCLRTVRAAAAALRSPSVPTPILEPTKRLIEHALLQNAGVYRRNAVDTLLAGGYTGPVISALNLALTNVNTQAWLKCRALFVISFLQDRERNTELILGKACKRAKKQFDASLTHGAPVPRSIASELHDALFAVGDCFGAVGAQAQSRRLRHLLDKDLDDLLLRTKDLLRRPDADTALVRVARGAAYLVAVTAQTGDRTSKPMLESLADHPDSATKDLAEWALKRFDARGDRVRPLYDTL